eukprot:jgi/Chrzof1/15220/Cz09g31320.t1
MVCAGAQHLSRYHSTSCVPNVGLRCFKPRWVTSDSPKQLHHRARRQAGVVCTCGHGKVAQSEAGTTDNSLASTSRRHILGAAGALCVVSAAASWLAPPPSLAALVQFPANELHNRYYLVRAGESEAESRDSVLTNPVWKTSMFAGLSGRGKAQVVRQTVPALQSLGVCGGDDDNGSNSSSSGGGSCWLWPSITQNAYQTAEVVAYLLGVGRNRIVPEYSFLDARGVGALDGATLQKAQDQLVAGDELDANWRPPAGYDGTPNESSADVLTRMTQVMSITETQFSGEDIVFIAPDSDTLSILQAAVLGIDLRRHPNYTFR